ncbi:MAG: CidA/LrgA family protein [Gemmobacter sp.]|nr:CidA/LrgA family protein [Gemmobacter sp.]
MIHALTIILCCQLVGEAISRTLLLPVPGPVLGMAILLVLCATVPGLADRLRPTTTGILANLSLLFVPAGVGVVGHLNTFGAEGPALAVAVIVSTIAAISAGALAFVAVAKLTGRKNA